MENQANFTPKTLSPRRQRQRGAVLVIILGLLVILALIGVSFQYLVMNEYNAARNWQARSRARSMAEDGLALAIARLRVEPTVAHWEGEGEWSYMSRRDYGNSLQKYARIKPSEDTQTATAPSSADEVLTNEVDFWRSYYRNRRLGVHDEMARVSYSVDTIRGANADGKSSMNWVDLNGNGAIDGGEEDLGRYLLDDADKPLRAISYFRGDGIDGSQVPAAIKSGTLSELGDRARLKVIDTNSQFNINDYKGAQLVYMLEVLGSEIETILAQADGFAQGDRKNPFPRQVAMDIVFHKDVKASQRIDSKEELRLVMRRSSTTHSLQFNEDLFDFAMDFIAVTSWPRAGNGENNIPRFDVFRNPMLERPTVNSPETPEWDKEQLIDSTGAAARDFRYAKGRFEGSATISGQSIDALPGVLPQGGRTSRAPFNINTVTLPVLTTMIAGIESEARFILLPRKGDRDKSIFVDDSFTGMRSASYIPTDLGQQPFFSQEENDKHISQHEHHPFLVDADRAAYGNLAPYQVIPVGPFTYVSTGNADLKPDWKDAKILNQVYPNDPTFVAALESRNVARDLALAILAERDKNGPFRSWMDFDYRVCHQILLGFNALAGSDGTTGGSAVPDLINIGRTSHSMPLDATTSDGTQRLLPDPDEILTDHPAYRLTGTTTLYSYSKPAFRAWYHRAAVDTLRANFNPDGYYNKRNPDSAMYSLVDVTDLSCQTAPMCFSTKGIYEVTSQGEIAGIRPDPNTGELKTYPVALRTFRATIETYRTLTHTSQSDFLRTYTDNRDRSATMHSLKGTMTYPNSIDISLNDYANDVPLNNI
ncbi:MAG: hypothetical protein KDB07_09385, partial [Planctomycetes bacterium]|nr:hypothetical protein [Planctomycetota bacterium]